MKLPGKPETRDGFRHVDRRLALGFGAIVLVLMLTVIGVSGYLFAEQQRKEEVRLSQALAATISEAISRVAFSGKYHTRLLLEELLSRVSSLSYISLETVDGLIIAHSDPERNDQQASPEDVAFSRDSLDRGVSVDREKHLPDGAIREIVLPYRAGVDAEVTGVVRIGVDMSSVRREQAMTPLILLVLAIVLTALAILMVGILSRYFGRSVRALATQLRGILEHAPLAIWISDRQGSVVAKSAEYDTLFGEMIGARGEGGFEMSAAAALEDFRRIDAEVFETGRMMEKEVGAEVGGKAYVWLVSKFPIAREESGGAFLVCTFLLDITGRKQYEQALQRSEAKFREIFNATNEAIMIHEIPSGRFMDVNESMLRMYGYDTKEQALKHDLQNFNIDDAPYTWGDAQVLIQKTLQEGPQVFEWRARKRSGEPFWVEVSLQESKIEGERCVIAVVRDIADRKRAEAERFEIERRMQHMQKLESLGVLAGGIAHDFNNILNAIMGHASLARLDLGDDSPIAESLDEIETATRRAAELCKQMLAYSGKGRFMIRAIYLPDLVEEMVQLLKASISKKTELQVIVEKDVPAVEGDSAQIHQVIMNLIMNAAEAIGAGGGQIVISIGSLVCTRDYLGTMICDDDIQEGTYAYVDVLDTGCGMDAQTRERVFEPFYTTKFTGRGLGMSAVLGIIRGHKGAISIHSELRKGSTFRVLFPAAASSVEIDVKGNAREKLHNPKDKGGVLLADDEETNREIGRRSLERLGYRVFLAVDGRQAIEEYTAHAGEITVVLLDLMMPNMDGEETFYALRKLNPDVHVVLASGYSEQDVVKRFAGKGLTAFLEKPYTLQTLRTVLEKVSEGMPEISAVGEE